MTTLTSFSDQQVHDFLAGMVTFCLVAWGLYLMLRWLRLTRPELAIGAPIAVAFGIRVLAAFGVSSTGVAASLRGGDEVGFFLASKAISTTPFFGPDWTHVLTTKLYEFVFATQIGALGSTQTVLRISQAGIAVAGLVLLAVAVYELAGRRAALIVSWVIAFDPANIFFSTLLHKEPNMLLAGGLVAFGGACMWKRARLQYLWPITLGCLIATATRPYAGWFLIAAGAAITLHVGLRMRGEGARSLTLVALVIMLGAISAPTVLKASTHESLSTLQASQSANVSDSSNLKLEAVDFSTRGAIITNLPQRIRDVVTRPYPWQLGNTSQQFGLLGTIFAWTVFWILGLELWRARGHIMERAGPLIYTGLFLLIAYSLSAGNAGTAFRYRTHIVALALCSLVVLRELRTNPDAIRTPSPAAPRTERAAATAIPA
ncbi:MAG: hypothetical protein ACJ75Z_03215 [Solirubrobacterales bacterium]